MKRLFVLLFAVCLTLPLYGCNSEEAAPKPEETPAAESGGEAESGDAGGEEESGEATE